MRLSLALGIPLTELQQRTSSRDFTRYLAFFSVEPWPEQRADFNAALVAAVIARCLSESEVDPDAFAPDYWASARARAEEKRRAAAPPPPRGAAAPAAARAQARRAPRRQAAAVAPDRSGRRGPRARRSPESCCR